MADAVDGHWLFTVCKEIQMEILVICLAHSNMLLIRELSLVRRAATVKKTKKNYLTLIASFKTINYLAHVDGKTCQSLQNFIKAFIKPINISETFTKQTRHFKILVKSIPKNVIKS